MADLEVIRHRPGHQDRKAARGPGRERIEELSDRARDLQASYHRHRPPREIKLAKLGRQRLGTGQLRSSGQEEEHGQNGLDHA